MSALSSHTANVPHAPESIYALWTAPSAWPLWDADVSEVRFEEQMALGASGRLRPSSGPAATFRVTELTPNRVFTDASRLPGAVLTFRHKIEPAPQGCTVTVVISISGPLRSLWKLLLGKNFRGAAERNITGLSSYLATAAGASYPRDH